MPALRIAIIYLLFGSLWIYISDNFLGVQITDAELLTQYQTYKGWFYVLITALLAYLLVAQALRRQSAAETSLHDSEARFQTIFDNVNDIILLRDADTGRIVEANAKALEQLGYNREELRRLSIADISADVPPYTQKNAMNWLARARQGETPTFEWRARRRDGSQFWLEINLRRVEIGDRIHILSVARDITERKQADAALLESEERLRSFFDNAQAIVWLKDLDGRFLMVNRYTEQMLGLPREQLLGRSVAEVFPEAEAETFANNDRKAILAGAPLTFDESAQFGDGLHTFFSTKFPLHDTSGRVYALGAICADITGRKQTEEQLRNEHSRLRSLIQTIPELVWMKDNEGIYLLCNPALERLFGAKEADIAGKTDYDFFDTELADFFHQNDLDAMAAGKPRINEEWVTYAADGKRALLETTKAPVRDENGRVLGVLGISRDITESRAAQEALSKSEALLRQSQRMASVGHYVFDTEVDLWSSSEELDSIFGIDAHYARNAEGWLQLVHPSQRTEMADYLTHLLESRSAFDKEYRIVRANDRAERWVHGMGELELDAAGRPIKLFGIIRDITERKAAESKIEHLAYHDQLTGLPNRLLARDRFEQAAAHAERSDSKVAMLFLDLDHFKTINDALGHVVGDALLKEVSARLRLCVRDTDTVSRQGGDEFLIVLTEVHDTDAITFFSTKMLEQLALPFSIDRHNLSSSVSIGAVVYPDDGRDFDTLLKKADTAMYHAKEAGRNACYFFDAQMNIAADELLAMRSSLGLALERGEFVVHYQPQVHLADGSLLGAEALLRWNHPELGLVPPARFIPIAEDCGLIVPIGEWVLREACRQAVAWQKSGMSDFTIAVNLSAVQFKRSNLEQIVIAALTESGLEPPFLELELTESILIRDTENVLQTVRQLKLLGVKLSIDDFGTGYSSLSYLSRFAVDKVKIDQSFVRGLTTSPSDAAIVRAIIQMARSLGLRTIAEGIEEQPMYDYLRAHHCDEAQGYHIGRPMPADEFAAYVAKNHPQPHRTQ
ncbi:MAG: PAS domain S-box protein [Gallionella sp.]|nr:PAS domain S-box protein [Gallionella sp.]